MKGRLLFDVTGLVQWYSYFPQPSGVQRVTERLLASDPLHQIGSIEFVVRVLGSDRFVKVEPQILLALGDLTRREWAVRRLRAVFAASMRLASPRGLVSEACYYHLPYIALGLSRLERFVRMWGGESLGHSRASIDLISPPSEADTLFNPGDFWCHAGYVAALIKLKQRTGVRIVQLIHDLFAIDRPDWTHPGFGHIISSGLGELAPQVDHWLTNSSFVSGQLRHYLAARLLPNKAIDILPMGWDSLGASRLAADKSDQEVLRRYGVTAAGFILHVGTIEPRKNLLTLLDAIAAIRREFSSRTPHCVLLGRDGWRSEAIHQRLKATRNEGGAVQWIKNAADQDLAAFYRSARFTVVASHAEGWGLPATESLAHGVPTIAADVGGLREAGQDLATYFDPTDPEGLIKAIGNWVADDQILELERARLARALSSRRLPTWQDTGAALLDAVTKR